ncbi:uncharacterized protein LOC116250021 isoform X5 [Nymphaea colorata]|uniref:uncharacterized protein LOC116250021 isoform X5 n=1 Tax=Nymphaea colorata TaxID=210225 RepID=UPI00214E3882|nr:uncharacterized protein LOC116250021 isoform X5 [Nymphaea colorata]
MTSKRVAPSAQVEVQVPLPNPAVAPSAQVEVQVPLPNTPVAPSAQLEVQVPLPNTPVAPSAQLEVHVPLPNSPINPSALVELHVPLSNPPIAPSAQVELHVPLPNLLVAPSAQVEVHVPLPTPGAPSSAEVVADLEEGRVDGRISSREEASDDAQSGPEGIVPSQSSTISRRSSIKYNLLIGFALMNPSSTSLFRAGSPSHALYMGLTSLGIAGSLLLSYAGDRMQSNVLLLSSTIPLLGALSMLGVEASVQAEFFPSRH